jgi:hypothetical protein
VRLAVSALIFAAPLFAHDILRSDAKIEVRGNQVRATVTLNLFELTSPIVPGSPRATPAQLDASIAAIFASFQHHYFLRSPAMPVRTTLGQYVLIDGNVVHMEATWDFADDITSLEVESRLDQIMPPGHKHFLAVRMGDTVQQAILAGSDTQATFTGIAIPKWQTALRFIRLGIEHIFTGYDHLAFLLGLLVATSTIRSLVTVVTSFTLAHSITLALATFQLVALPSRLTESLIAVSIGYIAAENLLDFRLMKRYYITFFFGLIHGFGFSNVLRDMDLPRSSLALSLFSFNLGVEIGQITFVLLIFPLVQDLMNSGWTRLKPAVSACIGVLAVWWFVQRAFLG